MIALLTGRLAVKAPSAVTLDVQGVGYEVFIPLSTFYSLPDVDQSVTLKIHTHVREDAIQLYGFLSGVEKESFLLLTAVSGIGPKLALSVLSTLPVPDLLSAIQADDIDKIATVPGIGKKSAGRIVLELKEKAARIYPSAGPVSTGPAGASDRLHDDALSALVNLGYRQADVKEVVKRILRGPPSPSSLQDLIREALKELAREA
ncbi:MAG TPA: Holliday junction branch migration protein RuvA [Nitrospiraceae bacterium]|nr:Holliday junction branch migration protein RuvA [Nitrospiraceae bacterium]